MSGRALVSIIVNNYNYGRFLTDAIESALSQTHRNTEVVVVDDGSTDDSRQVIARYGKDIVPVLKGNGGQASALNAGFRVSKGEVICFLDADDVLLPSAVAKAVELLGEGNVAKVHWPLLEVDGNGRWTGEVMPRDPLIEGDLRDAVVREGPEAYVSPPTSGNAWARSFLERVFPLPEIEGYRYGGADVYLSCLAPLFGRVGRILEPQGCYRLHGDNNYSRLAFDAKFRQDLWCYDDRCLALTRYCRELGIGVDPEKWKRDSWLHRFPVAREELMALIAPGDALILVDQGDVGSELVPGRRAIPFLERDGQYWGRPPDDDTAIVELDRLRRSGARFIVFAWPAFWWLEYYSRFQQYLRAEFRCLLANERLVVFDLRSAGGPG